MAERPSQRSRASQDHVGPRGPRRRSNEPGFGRSPSAERPSRSPEGAQRSYYADAASDQKVYQRPGAPPGGKAPPLGEDPFEWVHRHAPEKVFELHADRFFTGTKVVGQVGKDEGLTGVRCMIAVPQAGQVWVGEREGCFSVWDSLSARRLMRSTKKKDLFVWSIHGAVGDGHVWLGWSDGFIRVFDSKTLNLVSEHKEHIGGVYALAGTPGNKVIFSGSSDFTIVKWESQPAVKVHVLTAHKNSVRSLLVVGARLYSGSDDHSIRVWDVATCVPLAIWEQHTGGVHALEFALGRHVWSASEDKTIRVWDVGEARQRAEGSEDTGTCIKVITEPHTGQINCLHLIGALMWSSSWNQTYVWDPRTFELKFSPREHEGVINALTAAHQSVVSRVWTASNDGVIKYWNAECPWSAALLAATDDRLEESRLLLESTHKALEEERAEKALADERARAIDAERKRLEGAIETERAQAAEAQRGLQRHWQDAQRQIQAAASRPTSTVDPSLLQALELASRGDAAAAAKVRSYLRNVAPDWRSAACAPVVPVDTWTG
eukprot:Hpha_TRINITY_DN23075_c0_g1::TRINITY_DN23075_c0_g1_i1::g.109326::m.109326/K10260/FBXW7, SEL10; F-box and WD-40 domain protein 7